MHARFPAALTCTCTRARTNRHHRPPAHTPAKNLNPVRPHSHPRPAARPPCICTRTCAGTYARRAGRSAPARRAVLHLHAARAGQHMHARLPAALTCTCSRTRVRTYRAAPARAPALPHARACQGGRPGQGWDQASSLATPAANAVYSAANAVSLGMGMSSGQGRPGQGRDRIRSGWEDQVRSGRTSLIVPDLNPLRTT